MDMITKIIQGVDSFPTLPTIYQALSDVIANPRSTTDDAAHVIQQDQACTSKILQTANSPIYSIHGKVDSISNAIFYIGFEEVKNLVIALSILDLFKKTESTDFFNPIDLWKHSIGVGVTTKIIGDYFGIKKVGNYFVSGIMHDIGKLFFIRYFHQEYGKVSSYAMENKITMREAETQKMGISHTNVGGLLCDKWKLPPSIKNAIKNHHTGIVGGKVDSLTGCVHIANIFAKILEFGNSGDQIIQQSNFEVLNSLSINNEMFTNILPKINIDYETSLTLFKLD